MSQGNVAYQTGNQLTNYPSTTPIKLINVKDATYDNLCVFGVVLGDPATYAAQANQWAKGAIIIDVSNALSYTNKGTVATPSWTVHC